MEEQVGSIAPVTRTPATSATNTPSKLPISTTAVSSTSTPTRNPPAVSIKENVPPNQQVASETSSKPPAGGVETSFSLAMRQAGKEAAEKAKSKPKSTGMKSSATSGADISKLDNSAPTGLPPPSGITDAASAMAPETGSAEVVSKTDAVPSTGTQPADTNVSDTAAASTASDPKTEAPQESTTDEVIDKSLGDLKLTEPNDMVAASSTEMPLAAPTGEIAKHRGSSISAASKYAIKEVEEANRIEEEPEEEEEKKQVVEDRGESTQPLETKDTEKTEKQEKSRDKEPHVQFTGEAPGEEIDRVKATLSRDASPAHKPGAGVIKGTNKTAASKKADEVQSDPSIPKTQDQTAAEPGYATESVAD